MIHPPARGYGLLGCLCLLLAFLLQACSDEAAQEPEHFRVIEVSGSPYQRGLQHGQALGGNIRSFYRRFLSAGIMPYLNSEQWQVAEVLKQYQNPQYADGKFGYEILLESALNLLEDIPGEYVEEMQGVAAGSGMPFNDILILNTFLDTLFGLRAVIFVLRTLDDPEFRQVLVETYDDKQGAWAPCGEIKPYEPSPYASLVDIPTRFRMRFLFQDPQGVRSDSVRIVMGYEADPEAGREGWKRVYEFDDDIITATPSGSNGSPLEVFFTPPEEMPPDTVVSLQIRVSDDELVQGHGPDHYHVMRDDRFVFKTVAAEPQQPQALHEIFNKGVRDERLQPVSIAFALRGSATNDGKLLAAHHFTGLDNDTAHKNAAVIVHKPEEGKSYVTVGLAGIVWGSSGMNSDGLVCMFNLSDTLDNPVTDQVLKHLLDAKLMSSGIPIGFLLREILEGKSTVEEAKTALKDRKLTFGWNVLLADAGGSMAGVEIDADILKNPFDHGYYTYCPEDSLPWELDPWGRPWASLGKDDLRMAMHYQANSQDFDLLGLLRPQRYWTTYYYRSLRSFSQLGEEIDKAYQAPVDPSGVIQILRHPELEDQRNSMNSAVFSPQDLRLWFGLGEVPATQAPFVELDFGALIGKGATR